jgi:sulfite reductase (NADPH) flavoprotein alpha-component
VQWPAASGDGDDRNPVRYLNDGVSQTAAVREDGTRPRLVFPTPSGRAAFHARPHLDAAELPDDDFPFVLNTGRLQHQWHTLTKTGKVAKLNKLNPGPFVELTRGTRRSWASARATRSRSPRGAGGRCCPPW